MCSLPGPFPERPAPSDFRLFECSNCGIVFLFPQPSETELSSYYDETYYGEERKKFRAPVQIAVNTFRSLQWKTLGKLLKPGDRMLDIGCGRGTLVKLARDAGIEAYGIERPSPLGHEVPWVLYKDLPNCNFPDGHFQVVVLWHVLEHLPDPVATLREIHRVLKPGGWLSLAVPNYGGAQARASGRHWFHLDLPRHFWHFSPSSLEALLVRIGFRVPSHETLSIEYDWFGTLQSWMNGAFHDDNGLYTFLKGSNRSAIAENAKRLALASLIAMPALGSALLDAAKGEGGTLMVNAQKIEQEKS